MKYILLYKIEKYIKKYSSRENRELYKNIFF
uniref:Uncharacterized protein n=1 Tax=viral metagenome TaxID=1070528 RepID=A0A6C0ADX1_9ZZZZ